MAEMIDVTDKIILFFVGETIAYTIDTKGSTSGQGIDATPSAVGTATLTDPDGADAAAQMSGSASLSTDTITTPSLTLTATGLYTLLIPMTVSGNTMYARMRILSKDTTP